MKPQGHPTPHQRAPSVEEDRIIEVRFSGIVVTCNESRHLRACLARLSFCDELIVVDLESNDDSVAIAKEFGARVVQHQRVPIVEPLRERAARLARNDWIVFCDPDEIQPEGLGEALIQLIAADPSVGLIAVPMQYYFRSRRLECTTWGICVPKPFIAHRDRARFSTEIHAGLQVSEGWSRALVPRSESLYVTHYWVDSFRELFAKHRRYLPAEAEAHYLRGERFGWVRACRKTLGSFKRSLLDHRGLLGGPTGWLLSLFHAWYTAMVWRELARYQRELDPR